jgi:5-methylcytosine-specific restriction protein A
LNGKRYPSKAIAGVAHKYIDGSQLLPSASFTGGEASVGRKLRQLGFVIDTPERNPPWSRDELILALDLYLTNPANPPGKGSSAVAELSTTLNKLHRLNGVSGAPTLRNENGVYLKMMNLRSLDPTYTAQGEVGMQSGGALEKVVWADYEGRRADLKADADQIRQAVTEASEAALGKLPEAPPYEGEEGGVIMRLHKRYERDPKLVAEKRKAAAATGDLACEVCGFDFKAAYGDLGEGYIEVHHTKPVHTLLAATNTKLSDLALFCANCHRMAHRRRIRLSVHTLRTALG